MLTVQPSPRDDSLNVWSTRILPKPIRARNHLQLLRRWLGQVARNGIYRRLGFGDGAYRAAALESSGEASGILCGDVCAAGRCGPGHLTYEGQFTTCCRSGVARRERCWRRYRTETAPHIAITAAISLASRPLARPSSPAPSPKLPPKLLSPIGAQIGASRLSRLVTRRQNRCVRILAGSRRARNRLRRVRETGSTAGRIAG